MCRILLPKILIGSEKKSMQFALYRISNRYKKHKITKINSRLYQSLKEPASQLLSEIHKGKTISTKHKQAISYVNKDRALHQSTKKKISLSKTGVARKPFIKCKLGPSNHNFGKIFSTKTKNKLKYIAQNREKITCLYCSTQSSPNNFARWHGANCKLFS